MVLKSLVYPFCVEFSPSKTISQSQMVPHHFVSHPHANKEVDGLCVVFTLLSIFRHVSFPIHLVLITTQHYITLHNIS